MAIVSGIVYGYASDCNSLKDNTHEFITCCLNVYAENK